MSDGLGSVARSVSTPAGTGHRLYRAFIFPLLVASGFAGLGYQMAWTRSLSVALGHEYLAVLAVLGAFFVGLALGGLVLNGALRRTDFPGRWYCALELTIGVWAMLVILILPRFNTLLPHLMGTDPGPLRHWGVAFGAALLILLPATTAMGATLPAMQRLGSLVDGGSRSVPGLYAANTAGAMLGALVSTFLLLPALGLTNTITLFAGLNITIAALMWIAVGRYENVQPARTRPGAHHAPVKNDSRVPTLLFFTGLLGLGFEVLVVRVLAQVLEGTVYSFAAVLTIYLGGTAAGAALYQVRQVPGEDPGANHRTTQNLLCLTAFVCLLGTGALWFAGSLYEGVFDLLGPGQSTGVVAELCVAAWVFLLPTLCMGALFSHLAQGGTGAHGLGRLLGVNTLGAALSPVIFGVILLPLVGAKLALVGLCLGYLILAVTAVPGPRAGLPVLAVGGLAGVLMLLPLPLRFVPTQIDSEVIAYREGVVAAVAVIEDRDGSRHLAVNNQFLMGGTATRFSDHRQSHLPLLLHGAARSALYLGLGTGITLQAAQYYPDLHVTGVELIPELLPLMPLFGVDVASKQWALPPRVLAADARRFVTADEQRYDVVIAEVFHPSRDGAGSLYTVEHFGAVRSRLAPGGLFCQWLPLFQLDLDVLQLIVRSFLEVFPQAQMHLAHYSLGQPLLCLLGSAEDREFTPDWLLERVHQPTLQKELVALRMNSDFALFGGYLGGAAALRRFAGDGALNTDDVPLVTYRAPAFVYGSPTMPAERLLRLLQIMTPERGGLLAPGYENSDFSQRLQRYWQARDVFLAAGVGVQPTGDVRVMLQQIREPLLAAVRISPDFTPAYEPLLEMARSLATTEPGAAIVLLKELEDANPTLPWARSLREQISGSRRILVTPNASTYEP